MTAKSDAALLFKQAVTQGQRCTLYADGKGGCDGPLDPAHWVPAQRLRIHTRSLPEEEQLRCVYDPRAARPLCRKHHHETDHRFRCVFYEDLPQSAIDHATEWGVLWSLERDYPSLEDLRRVV